ncbi:MAG: phosphatidylserine decarboxylase [Deltaproteobacteria bacterium]|nr:phosphatidylserine decarboxylase [Deltaproteobacteria bacterium]
MYAILRFLPKNYLSFLVGKLASLPLPRFLSGFLIKLFARVYLIDLGEVEKDISLYHSLDAFFTRRLKPGVRPIGEGLVSPVDGAVRGFGEVQNGRLEQIKGKDYSVEALLGHSSYAARFLDGFYFNLYLSPRDYHRVHAPISGEVVAASYIPGKLWPVNDWSLSRIPHLFVVNERVVTYLSGAYGLVAVVMVGATNVGKISLSYCDWITNQRPQKLTLHQTFSPAPTLEKGEELGVFHLGSTVIILCEKNSFKAPPKLPATVRMGEILSVPFLTH